MRGLLRAELSRIRCRRMTWIVLLVGLLFVGLNAYAAYDMAKPLSIAEQQRADEEYQRQLKPYDEHKDQMLASCREAQATSPDIRCDDMKPQREWFGKPAATMTSTWGMFRDGAGFFFGLLALLLGASYVGAEFGSGAIANWLTFEPRRGRVFVSKLAAPVLATLVGGAVLVAGLVALCYGVLSLAQGRTDVARDVWVDVAQSGLRMVGFLGLCSLGGAAAAFLLRRTAAVTGLVIGYGVLEQIFSHSLGERVRWTLMNNAAAVLSNEHTIAWSRCEQTADGHYACHGFSGPVFAMQGFAVLGGVTLAVILLAWLVFRRRDVA